MVGFAVSSATSHYLASYTDTRREILWQGKDSDVCAHADRQMMRLHALKLSSLGYEHRLFLRQVLQVYQPMSSPFSRIWNVDYGHGTHLVES